MRLQVCDAFVGAVASGQASDVQSMRTALQALSQLSKVLQAAEACLASLTAHPAFENSALWSGSILPLVDTVLFSERWVAGNGRSAWWVVGEAPLIVVQASCPASRLAVWACAAHPLPSWPAGGIGQ